MINLTTTIQEITMQAYSPFGIYDYLYNTCNESRDEIFNRFEEWGKEFEELEKEHKGEDDWYYYDEIDEFLVKKFDEIKLSHLFPAGIAIGDYLTYEGGLYKITGFGCGEIIVDEVRPGNDKDWIVCTIGFSQADKIKILDCEEIMDTTQNHDPELVRKINQAWNEKREQFCPILRALYDRDIKEIMDSDAWNWTDNVESVKETLHDEWDFHADNYLMHIADDLDLKAILAFLRYKV
jgi:hypothetical protein